jgi:hypothetical protein
LFDEETNKGVPQKCNKPEAFGLWGGIKTVIGYLKPKFS